MIRSTTGGVLRTYRSNLMHSFVTLNGSRNTVLTQRNFNSYAEDPAAAARAFQMRRSLARVEAQYAVNDSVKRKYDTAFSAIGSVQDLVKSRSTGDNAVAWDTVLRGLNDPTGDARTALGKALNQMADTVIQSMNSKYGETFIFAGADGLNVPFTWEDNKLYFRGVPVDASVPDVLKDGGNPVTIDPATGQIDPNSNTYLKMQNTSEISPDGYQDAVDAKADVQDLYDTATKVADALGKYMANTPATNPDGSLASDPIQYLLNSGDIAQSDVDTLKDAGLLTQDSSYVASVTIPELPTIPKVLKDENGDPVKFDSNGDIVTDPTVTDFHYLVIGDDEDVQEVDPESLVSADDYKTAEEDVAKLKYMLNDESTFVDIGLGMKENPLNQLIESSAFDSSLQGITYLGYGLDEDGDPKNIVSLLKEMAAICTNYVNEPWSENSVHYDDFNRLAGKLEDAMGHLDSMYTDLSAATQKLKNNGELLEENAYNLTEQISGVEDVDMAEAITSFIWAQYCYNAALKVGNSILSQSLMDYLN